MHSVVKQAPREKCLKPSHGLDILILGVHTKSEAYPNVKYIIKSIKGLDFLHVAEMNTPMLSNKQLNKGGSLTKFIASSLKILTSHFIILFKYLKKPNYKNIYVPYPATFLLFLFSFFPGSRPSGKIVIDAFISIYDTIVNDRKIIASQSLPARLLKLIEKRAFDFADTVITDTKQNKEFYSSLFDLPKEKFIAIPLSTNEDAYHYTPYVPSSNVTNVLFIGTMIPLHGIEIILQAAKLLSSNENITFTLIGNGQEGKKVKNYIQKIPDHINWVNAWQSPDQLAEYISKADICLGIFGSGEKTQRVCPYKIYSYLSCGRPVITAETKWTFKATEGTKTPPFSTVPPGNGKALAEEIVRLSNKPEERSQLALSAQQFYMENYSNQVSIEKLGHLFKIQSSS